jgi:hypothetical protein
VDFSKAPIRTNDANDEEEEEEEEEEEQGGRRGKKPDSRKSEVI